MRSTGARILILGILTAMGSPSKAVVAPAAQALPRATIPNLVAYWDFEGTANDISGNGHNGTLQSGATITNAQFAPFPGSTRSVNLTQANAQSYVSVPSNAALNLTGPFTLAAWIRPTNPAVTNQQGIIERFGGGGGYILRLSANGVTTANPSGLEDLNNTVFAGGTTTYAIGTFGGQISRRIEANVWNHVAFTFDGTTLRNYEEAGNEFSPPQEDPTFLPNASNPGAVQPPAPTTAELRIGRDYGANGFEGQIDEARIYNKGLTMGELNVLMNGQPPPTGLTATSGPGLIDLSWTAPAPVAGVTVTYAVKRSPPGANTWTILAEGLTGTTYQDSGYVAVTTWDYAVTAVSVVESVPTAVVQGVTLSLVPRTNDHQEGLFEDKCACGSSIPGGLPGGLALALASLGLLLLARRS